MVFMRVWGSDKGWTGGVLREREIGQLKVLAIVDFNIVDLMNKVDSAHIRTKERMGNKPGEKIDTENIQPLS